MEDPVPTISRLGGAIVGGVLMTWPMHARRRLAPHFESTRSLERKTIFSAMLCYETAMALFLALHSA